MLTFQPLDILIAFAAGLILVAGLTLLALRRRNEILQEFLTPDEPDIEKEFFKRRAKEIADKQIVQSTDESDVETAPDGEDAGWGESATSP